MADAPAQGNAQQYQDALSQLWARVPDPNQPSPTLLPGMPGAAPDTSALPANGTRSTVVPYNATSTPVAPPPVPPKATDDPALAMPALPTPPTYQMPDLLNKRLATRAAIQDVENSHANDARDFRPHWYDRLLGGVTGAVVGGLTGDAKEGATMGGKLTNRAFNRADAERQRQLAPLFRNLKAEGEDESMYKGADTAKDSTFKNQMEVAKEGRAQQTATETAEYKNDLNDIKQQMANNKHEEAESRIKELQAKLDEQSQHNKDWLQVQNDLLELRSKLLDAKIAGKKGQAHFDTIQKDKATAEQRADTAFATATAGLKPDSPDYQQALENKIAAYRAAQANYEQRIETAGGEPDHIQYDESGVARNDSGTAVGPAGGTPAPAASAKPGPAAPAPAAKPAAQSGPPATLWKGKEGKILTLKDPSSGKESKWHLVNGTPQPLNQ